MLPHVTFCKFFLRRRCRALCIILDPPNGLIDAWKLRALFVIIQISFPQFSTKNVFQSRYVLLLHLKVKEHYYTKMFDANWTFFNEFLWENIRKSEENRRASKLREKEEKRTKRRGRRRWIRMVNIRQNNILVSSGWLDNLFPYAFVCPQSHILRKVL